MQKRRPSFTDQILFDTVPKQMEYVEGELANLERIVSSAVAFCLNKSTDCREEIAESVTFLLGENVTKLMLDAYASEARKGHAISFHRFLAIISVTRRYDILDAVVKLIGGRFLIGEQLDAYQVGELTVAHRASKIRLDDELDRLFAEKNL